MPENLNKTVRKYWEQEPCGTGTQITGNYERETPQWFEQIEQHRYNAEPFIHSTVQFKKYAGKKVLEIGVGAGTDHLQWAQAGLDCYGVDLTDAAIQTTQKHLELYGLKSNLQRIDAEKLPFDDNTFDVVYSWGVIHHSEKPELIIAEIKRVLKEGGAFIGMMYGRYSLVTLKIWIKHALLKGKPWRSFKDVLWNHMESVGTKAYTIQELRKLFANFHQFSAKHVLTIYDTHLIPNWISQYLPNQWGWFITLKVKK